MFPIFLWNFHDTSSYSPTLPGGWPASLWTHQLGQQASMWQPIIWNSPPTHLCWTLHQLWKVQRWIKEPVLNTDDSSENLCWKVYKFWTLPHTLRVTRRCIALVYCVLLNTWQQPDRIKNPIDITMVINDRPGNERSNLALAICSFHIIAKMYSMRLARHRKLNTRR